jgi:hypothetical protein
VTHPQLLGLVLRSGILKYLRGGQERRLKISKGILHGNRPCFVSGKEYVRDGALI